MRLGAGAGAAGGAGRGDRRPSPAVGMEGDCRTRRRKAPSPSMEMEIGGRRSRRSRSSTLSLVLLLLLLGVCFSIAAAFDGGEVDLGAGGIRVDGAGHEGDDVRQGGGSSSGIVAAAGPSTVPASLRNMLLYAEHLSSAAHAEEEEQAAMEAGSRSRGGSGRRRGLLGLDDDEQLTTGAGCGFYDVFYEGCLPCFYTPDSCDNDDIFYDFYTGHFLAHPPKEEYREGFDDPTLATLGDRNGPPAVWQGNFRSKETPRGELYLGGLLSNDTLSVVLKDVPAANTEYNITVDVLSGDHALPPPRDLLLTIAGEGEVPSQLVSSTLHTTSLAYSFNYTLTDMKLVFTSPFALGEWGIDNLLVTSTVGNYPPVAEDRQIFALPDQSATVELRATDDECQHLTMFVTSLPTQGTLFLCSCDSLWSTPITASMLPAEVRSRSHCSRVVYAPEANRPLPLEGVSGPFDQFEFVASDGYTTSAPAVAKIYVQVDDTETDTPLAGLPGLALSFDGVDDVISISRTETTQHMYEQFTLEARFKTRGDVRSTATLLHKSQAWSLGWLPSSGLTFSLNTTEGQIAATSQSAYDDGLWHHVAAVWDGRVATLYVDGKVVAASIITSNVPTLMASTSDILIGSQGSENDAHFKGYVDEVRMWSYAAEMEQVQALNVLEQELSGTESGLVVYLACNDGLSVAPVVHDKTLARNDAFFGLLNSEGYSDGIPSRFPTYAASTASFGNHLSAVGGSAVNVTLHGADNDGGVTFYIATLPVFGQLYEVNGRRITSSPWALNTTTIVTYVPDAGASGNDIFKYQAYDGVEFSYRQGVIISVSPLNSAPIVSSSVVNTNPGEKVLIRLHGSDAENGTELDFILTALPHKGLLYEANSRGRTRGGPLNAINTKVDNYVVYVPDANGRDSGDDVYDKFAYVASDGLLLSQEAYISIHVNPVGFVASPVAGDAGYALSFDGVTDKVVLKSLRSYGANESMTIEAWFKTFANTLVDDMTLVSAGPLTVYWSRVAGLTISINGVEASTYAAYNDGSWHHLSISVGDNATSIIVDGELRAFSLLGNVAMAVDEQVVIGIDADGLGAFGGQLDELSIWSHARSVDEVAHSAQGALTRGAKGLKAYYRFNEAQGSGITDEVSGHLLEDALGGSGVAEMQPTWVVSSVGVGNVANATQGVDMLLNLTGSSESMDTYDLIIVELPRQGALYEVEANGTRGTNITYTPWAVSTRAVIYNSGSYSGAFGDNFGTFVYVAGEADEVLDINLDTFYDHQADQWSLGRVSPHQAYVVHVAHRPVVVITINEDLAPEPVADEHAVMPIAGEAGAALQFNGVATEMTLGRVHNYLNDSFTLGLWFRTTAAPSPAGMALVSSDFISIGWDLVWGLHVRVGEYIAPTLQNFNDASWHFLAAEWNTTYLSIYVDAQHYASIPTLPYLQVNDSLIVIGVDSVCDGFNGQLDEVSIWSVSVADNVSRTAFEDRIPFTGNETGLAGYWRFNGHVDAVLFSEMAVYNSSEEEFVFGESGKVNTQPAIVASTIANFSRPVVTNEDEPVGIHVVALTFTEDEQATRLKIVRAPYHGKLTQHGHRVRQDDSVSADVLVYTPDLHYVGVDSFVYAADDGVQQSDSHEVNITIIRMQHRPTVRDIEVEANMHSWEPVTIHLHGHHVHYEPLVYCVTTLPVSGLLYDPTDNTTDTPLQPNSCLVSGRVIVYTPLPAVNASAGDSFGYTASTHDGWLSAEGRVTITPEAVFLPPGSTPLPGAGGFALAFNGDSVATLGSIGDHGLGLDNDASFVNEMTLSIQFRTAYAAEGSTLIRFGPLALEWSSALGLYAVVEEGANDEVVLPTYQPWNDGVWHIASVTVNSTHASLAVNGSVLAAQKVANVTFVASDVVVLGSNSPSEGYFKGEVDDVRAYLNSLNVARFFFNEDVGSGLINNVTGMLGGELGYNGHLTPQRVPSTAPVDLSFMTESAIMRLSGPSHRDMGDFYIMNPSFVRFVVSDATNHTQMPVVSLTEISDDAHMLAPTGGNGGYALSFAGDGLSYVSVANADIEADSFTVEAWINSSDGIDVGTIVASEAFALQVHYALGAVFTVRTGAGPVSVESFTQLNDGNWHYLAGTWDSLGTIKVYVDGEQVGSATVDSYSGVPLIHLITIGQDIDGMDSFAGFIDEVKVSDMAFNAAEWEPEAPYYWDAAGLSAPQYGMPGLKAHYRMNEGSGSLVSDASGFGRMGEVHSSGTLAWVMGAPMDNSVTLAEDTEATVISLQVSPTLTARAVIAGLPANGTLFNTADGLEFGEEIESVPALVTNDNGLVVYVPDADFNGEDHVAYYSMDQEGRITDTIIVALDVRAINDPPVATYVSANVSIDKNTDALLRVSGKDVDGPLSPPHVYVVTLPQFGMLYQVDHDNMTGNMITEVPSLVEGTYVLYVPDVNGYGDPYDAVTLILVDSEDEVSMTEEITIPITVKPTFLAADPHAPIDQPAVPVNTPVAGESGHALRFDGQTVSVTLGTSVFSANESNIDVSNVNLDFNGTFTMELWFRTSAVPDDYTTLISKGVVPPVFGDHSYSLHWTKMFGLGFYVTTADGYTTAAVDPENPQFLNDGAWHFVSAVWSTTGGSASMYVDGELIATTYCDECELGITPLIVDELVTVGRSASDVTTQYFAGTIDEVRMLRRQRNPSEIWNDWYEYRAANASDPLMAGYWRFNEAVGDSVSDSNRKPFTLGGTVAGALEHAWVPSTLPMPSVALINPTLESVIIIPLVGGDADDNQLSFSLTELPQLGTLYPVYDGVVDYSSSIDRNDYLLPTPAVAYAIGNLTEPVNSNYTQFDYSVSDGRETSAPETVYINVVGVNRSPVAHAQFIDVLENTPTTIKLDCSDPDGNGLTAVIIESVWFGFVDGSYDTPYEVTPQPDGTLTILYEPSEYFNSPEYDTFTYVAVDDFGAQSEPATVTINVIAVNNPPVLTANPRQGIFKNLAVLTGIYVDDVDVFESPDGYLTVTITAKTGKLGLSADEALGARAPNKVIINGDLISANQQLAHVWYLAVNGPGSNDTLDILVSDNGFTGRPMQHNPITGQMEVYVYDSLIDNVMLSNDGSHITVTWKYPTNTAGTVVGVAFDCSDVLEASTVNRLGDEAHCNFMSDTTLEVWFGGYAELVPGDALAFIPNTIAVYVGGSSNAVPNNLDSADIAAPINPTSASALIWGPDSLSSCEDLYMDGYSSSGDANRDLSYQWIVAGLPSRFLTLWLRRNPESYVWLPSSEVPGGKSYSLTLVVSNWLRSYSAPALKQVYKSRDPIPYVAISGPQYIEWRSNIGLFVDAYVDNADCVEDITPTLTQKWSETHNHLANLPQPDNLPMLYIPPGTMQALDSPYTFRITVTECYTLPGEDHVSCYNNAADATVALIPRPLVADIEGGQARLASTSLVLTLDASRSYDPEGSTISFSWSCETLAATGVSISSSCGNTPPPSSALWKIPAGSIAAGNYSFTVTVSDPATGRADSATTIVEMTDASAPSVTVRSYSLQHKVNPEDILLLDASSSFAQSASGAILFSWKVQSAPLQSSSQCQQGQTPECTQAPSSLPNLSNPAVVLTSNTQAMLELQHNVLVPGRYLFTVYGYDASNVDMQGYASIAVVVNSPPTGGMLLASPRNGTELVTVFTLKASSFADADTPLQYQFGIMVKGKFVGLSSKTATAVFNTTMAANVTAAVRVFDGLGASTVATTQVQVRIASAGTSIQVISNAINNLINNIVPNGNPDAIIAEAIKIGLVINNLGSNGNTTQIMLWREQLVDIVLKASLLPGANADSVADAILIIIPFGVPITARTYQLLIDWLTAIVDNSTLLPELLAGKYMQIVNILMNAAANGLVQPLAPANRRRLLALTQSQFAVLDVLVQRIAALALHDPSVPAGRLVLLPSGGTQTFTALAVRHTPTQLAAPWSIGPFSVPAIDASGIGTDVNFVFRAFSASLNPYDFTGEQPSAVVQGLFPYLYTTPRAGKPGTTFPLAFASEQPFNFTLPRLAPAIPPLVPYCEAYTPGENNSSSFSLVGTYTYLNGGDATVYCSANALPHDFTAFDKVPAPPPPFAPTPGFGPTPAPAPGPGIPIPGPAPAPTPGFGPGPGPGPSMSPPVPVPTVPPPPLLPPSSPPGPPSKGKKSRNVGAIVGGVVGGFFALVLIVLALVAAAKRKQKKMRRLIINADEGEMLSSTNGVVDVGVAARMGLPRAPVAGAMRTYAQLENEE
eukprot:jgi/Chlat1/9224/Chrsp99S08484